MHTITRWFTILAAQAFLLAVAAGSLVGLTAETAEAQAPKAAFSRADMDSEEFLPPPCDWLGTCPEEEEEEEEDEEGDE